MSDPSCNIREFACLRRNFGKKRGDPGYDGDACDWNDDGRIDISDWSIWRSRCITPHPDMKGVSLTAELDDGTIMTMKGQHK